MMTTFEQYETKVAGFEADAQTVTGKDREILAACAGAFADQLEAALWTGEDTRRRGFGLAARARKVEQALLAAVLA